MRKLFLKLIGISRLEWKLENQHYENLINFSLIKGNASANIRKILDDDPSTWEFSGFSQNGEDGIIDYLINNLENTNKFFIEIGSADGFQNNTTWLALTRRWKGIMIDGNENLIIKYNNYLKNKLAMIDCFSSFISLKNIAEIQKKFKNNNPDVFSLDIDGNDYHIMDFLLQNNFRPKIIIVEYNSSFGPNIAMTLKYQENFIYNKPLSYGCSINAWKKLFNKYNYTFISSDTSGVNAFFINPTEFKKEFINKPIKKIEFKDNWCTVQLYNNSWQEQYEIIKKELFIEV